MATHKKQKITCVNCGREILGINAAKNDGWIFQEDGNIFCCCVCVCEFRDKQRKASKKKKSKP